MILTDGEFWRALAPKLEKRREDRIEQMTGGGCSSFDAYRQSVGYLEALKDVLADAEEAFEDLSKPRTPGAHFTGEA